MDLNELPDVPDREANTLHNGYRVVRCLVCSAKTTGKWHDGNEWRSHEMSVHHRVNHARARLSGAGFVVWDQAQGIVIEAGLPFVIADTKLTQRVGSKKWGPYKAEKEIWIPFAISKTLLDRELRPPDMTITQFALALGSDLARQQTGQDTGISAPISIHRG